MQHARGCAAHGAAAIPIGQVGAQGQAVHGMLPIACCIAWCSACMLPAGPAAARLEHVLLQDEVLAPQRGQVLLHGAAGRAVVVEARHGAVDFEAGHVEHAPLQRLGLRSPCTHRCGCPAFALAGPWRSEQKMPRGRAKRTSSSPSLRGRPPCSVPQLCRRRRHRPASADGAILAASHCPAFLRSDTRVWALRMSRTASPTSCLA